MKQSWSNQVEKNLLYDHIDTCRQGIIEVFDEEDVSTLCKKVNGFYGEK